MDFNFDTGSILGGLQTLDVSTLPPLGGQAGVLTILGTGAVTLPQGTQGQRPATAAAGMFRYDVDTTLLEYYNGTTWAPLATSASSVSSVAANSNSSGLTITGSPITGAGTFQFTLDAGLQNLSTHSTTGLLVATGADTWASRTIAGTAGNIVVVNGDGIAANPTVDLATVTNPGTGGSFVKVTTDTFGRVTNSTAVVTADITALVDNTYVNLSGDTMASGANLTFTGGGEVLGLPPSPSSDTAAVSKAYVDSVAAGLSWKQAVKVATTSDISLSGLQTVDGYTTVAGDRVLVKAQTAESQNGIYIAAAGAWVRATDMDQTSPLNEINGAATFVENGTTYADTGWTQINTVTVIGTDPIEWVQYSGSGTYTAGSGLTLTGTVFSISTPVAVSVGGTGITATPTNGQLLIGNGAGYTLATLTGGTGIGITEGSGAITVANTGVVSVAGTANEIEVSAATGAVTIGLPDNVTVGSSLTVSGLTPNSSLYVGAGGLISSTAALADGQILVGSTGSAPVAATLTAGTGIGITNTAGAITISSTGGTVTSIDVSGGTTGLTTTGGPVTGSGTITLAGTLAVANGGTGLAALGAANQVLGVDAAGTGAEYKTIAAGTGMQVVHGANVVTLNNTGVTSVALTAPSIFTVSGSPVTASGTLDFALNTQAANTVFAGPATGVDATPAFRSLSYADLPIVLYKENTSISAPIVASGNNAVAIGSGASATADETVALGAGSSARINGQKAFANGSFATAGDAQAGLYVARNVTTDSTVTELFLDGVSQQLVIPANSLFTFEIFVAARRTDAVGGGAGYRFVGIARRDATAGSVTFVGTPSKTVIGETNTAWDATVSVDTTTGAFRVSGRGETSKTIRWVATIHTTEVTN